MGEENNWTAINPSKVQVDWCQQGTRCARVKQGLLLSLRKLIGVHKITILFRWCSQRLYSGEIWIVGRNRLLEHVFISFVNASLTRCVQIHREDCTFTRDLSSVSTWTWFFFLLETHLMHVLYIVDKYLNSFLINMSPLFLKQISYNSIF